MALIVTGFYDLEKFETRRTPTDTWARRANWLLSQDARKLVYTDAGFRNRLGSFPCATTYLPVIEPDFSDLDRVTQNLSTSRIAWDPLKDTPRYFCLMRHRISWMVDATSRCFEDEVLTWADLCLPHRADETSLRDVLANPPATGKIRMCEISYVPRAARESVDRYYERHWWPVGGGLWSARPAEIRWLAEEMGFEWRLCLRAGYVATDEMLIGRVLIQHPERFEVYYGDHPSLAENWCRVHGSRELILEMAVRALEDGNTEEGLRRCRALRS